MRQEYSKSPISIQLLQQRLRLLHNGGITCMVKREQNQVMCMRLLAILSLLSGFLVRKSGRGGSQLSVLVALDLVNALIGHSCFPSEIGPTAHSCDYAIQHPICVRLLDAGRACEREQVCALESVSFVVDTHLVSARPFACGIPCVRNVEGRRESPFTSSIHKECDVLDVIVAIPAYDVKKGSQHLLLCVLPRKTQAPNDLERLFVGIARRLPIVKVGQSSK